MRKLNIPGFRTLNFNEAFVDERGPVFGEPNNPGSMVVALRRYTTPSGDEVVENVVEHSRFLREEGSSFDFDLGVIEGLQSLPAGYINGFAEQDDVLLPYLRSLSMSTLGKPVRQLTVEGFVVNSHVLPLIREYPSLAREEIYARHSPKGGWASKILLEQDYSLVKVDNGEMIKDSFARIPEDLKREYEGPVLPVFLRVLDYLDDSSKVRSLNDISGIKLNQFTRDVLNSLSYCLQAGLPHSFYCPEKPSKRVPYCNLPKAQIHLVPVSQ